MSLTFIVILLLVIGIVVANIALLRFGSKPMPSPHQPATKHVNPESVAEKTQAAAISAIPLTIAPSTAGSNNNNDTKKHSASEPKVPHHNAADTGENGSSGD